MNDVNRGFPMLFRSTTLIAVLICIASCSEADAQSLFGGSGATGATGGTNTGGRATGTSGAQGQTTSGVNTGQELGTTNLNNADGSLSATVGQGGFVGGQNSGTFIGNRFAGQTASQGTQAQFGGLQNSNRGQNRNASQRSDRKPVRPRFRIAFTPPMLPQDQVQARLTPTSMNFPPILSNVSSVNIQVDDQGIATLTGSVATRREQKLLESYVRMEPGIRGVQNSMTIQDQ